MPQKRFYSLIVLLSIVAIVLAACAPPAPTATQAPAATEEPTEAPIATEEPAATEPSTSDGTGTCPAITLADMQGVPAGQWPQQYELAEFETLANCTLTITGRTEFDPRLAETGHLPEGDAPPVVERLPEEPLVVVPYDEIGKYGGRFS